MLRFLSVKLSPIKPVTGVTYYGAPAGEIKNWRKIAFRRYRLFSIGSLILSVIVIAIIVAIGAWQRRWIADDGLIVLRTVRNLLAGNGPVFNQGERVEVNTSPIWTYVLYVIAMVTGVRLEYISLLTAFIMGIAALIVAVYATGRMYLNQRATFVAPCGALVYIALPPSRDFITSGLEVSAVLLWISILWALSLGWIRRGYRCPTRFLLSYSFWAGLGVLFRPDLAILSIPIVVLVFFRTPRLMRKIGLMIMAGFLPVSYEIFRMGYYGIPVPNTAIAKDANGSKWSQGWVYVWDLIYPYQLWLPAIILTILAVSFWLYHRKISRIVNDSPYVHYRTRRLPTSYEISYPISGDMYATRGVKGKIANIRYRFRFPTIPKLKVIFLLFEMTGLLQAVYWIRQGGDFMHARVLLPAIFIFLLPVMCVPMHTQTKKNTLLHISWKFTGLLITIWVIWVFCSDSSVPTSIISRNGIVNERQFYAIGTAHAHPITTDDYADYIRMDVLRKSIAQHPQGGVYFAAGDYDHWVYSPYLPGKAPSVGQSKNTVFFLNLGMPGMLTPLNVRVIDQMGLAYPLAAHSNRLKDGRIGHDKNFPPDWVIAQYHAYPLWGMNPAGVQQANLALTCPATQELIQSYTAPLTLRFFLHNIKHSFQFMEYRIDRIPEYSDELCGLVTVIHRKK